MTDPAARSLPLVIAIGNPDRADDGAGPLAAARIEAAVPSAARVLVRSADPLGLIDDWADEDLVVLIDAASPYGGPGTIHRWVEGADPLPTASGTGSTHGFGIETAIGLARVLARLPQRLVVYAIEGAAFDRGAPIDPTVARAAAVVADRVLDELRSVARCASPTGSADPHEEAA